VRAGESRGTCYGTPTAEEWGFVVAACYVPRRHDETSDLQHLDARLRRLLDVFGGEGPVPEVLKDECVRLDAERRGLLLELEGLDREVDGLQSRSVDLTGLRTSLVEFAGAYPNLDLVGRKRLMGSLVVEIVVESCGGVNGKAPASARAAKGEIRTRTYRVNISLAGRAGESGPVHPRRLIRNGICAGSPKGYGIRNGVEVQGWLRYYPYIKGEPMRVAADGPPPFDRSRLAVVPGEPRESRRERAERYMAMLESGEVGNRTELARLEGISKPMVTKVLRALEAPSSPSG